MEIIKWVFSTCIALVVAVVGIGVAISAVVFSIFAKVILLFTVLFGMLVMLVKEKLDERSDK